MMKVNYDALRYHYDKNPVSRDGYLDYIDVIVSSVDRKIDEHYTPGQRYKHVNSNGDVVGTSVGPSSTSKIKVNNIWCKTKNDESLNIRPEFSFTCAEGDRLRIVMMKNHNRHIVPVKLLNLTALESGGVESARNSDDMNAYRMKAIAEHEDVVDQRLKQIEGFMGVYKAGKWATRLSSYLSQLFLGLVLGAVFAALMTVFFQTVGWQFFAMFPDPVFDFYREHLQKGAGGTIACFILGVAWWLRFNHKGILRFKKHSGNLFTQIDKYSMECQKEPSFKESLNFN